MALRDDGDANTCFEPPLDELSATWQKLLGIHKAEVNTNSEMAVMPSSLAEDPWSELLQAQGVEIVDLQHIHKLQIALSEKEVEQALQIMQEQPIEGKNQG